MTDLLGDIYREENEENSEPNTHLITLKQTKYGTQTMARHQGDKPGGGTPYNGLYGKAPPVRGTFFTLQVYERVRISRVQVYERVGKSVI